MNEQTKGVLLMAASAIFFSIGGLFIKMIPWGPLSINGVRCIVGAIVFALYLIWKKKKPVFNIPTFIGALGVMATTIFYNTATKFTTAGNAITLEYTSPIFIILMAYLFFKKKPQKADIIAACVVFFGIFWFFLDSLSTGHFFGNLLGLCAAVSVSVIYVMKLHPKVDVAYLIFYGLLMGAVICLPSLATETQFSAEIWSYALALGVFQQGIAYILFFLGLTRCNPVPAVLASSLEPILNPIWVAVFYGEMISPIALPGIVIVLLTVLIYNIYIEKQSAKNTI